MLGGICVSVYVYMLCKLAAIFQTNEAKVFGKFRGVSVFL